MRDERVKINFRTQYVGGGFLNLDKLLYSGMLSYLNPRKLGRFDVEPRAWALS